MDKTKVLLDTNILIYEDDLDSVFCAECDALLARQDLDFFVTDKVLIEYCRVMTSNNSKFAHIKLEDVLASIQNYTEAFKVIFTNDDSLALTLELARRYKAKSGKIFDLNILAAAVDQGIDILCTKNTKDYPNHESIKILEPANI